MALVTGAAHRVGKVIAMTLAREGADIVVHYGRSVEAAQQTGQEIAALGRRVLLHQADMGSWQQAAELGERALAHFGHVDILINSASSFVPNDYFSITEADFDQAFDVNVKGPFVLSQVIAKVMMASQAEGICGNIINIASISGMIGRDRRVYAGTEMGGSTVDYAAAKGGVINLTRDMAAWLARYNIRVNCISPGGFWRNQPEPFVKAYSDATPMGRMGQDGREMKGPVVFLASEASSYCTGINLVVDGGFTCW